MLCVITLGLKKESATKRATADIIYSANTASKVEVVKNDLGRG